MIKIIQIATMQNGDIYGIDDKGLLYYWGEKKIKEEIKNNKKGNYEKAEYIHGWRLQEDQINSPKTINY